MPTVAYRRRTPETEPLYQAMSGHLETFLTQLQSMDRQLPRHVEKEMRAYWGAVFSPTFRGRRLAMRPWSRTGS